jgi:LCP family protein required for cell wall assembly
VGTSPLRRWLALALLITAVAAGVWAATRGPGELRHASARSFRSVVGAPEPPPRLRWEDEGPTLATQPRASRWTLIPTAEVEAPPPPRRPPGLDGVSMVLLLGADNRSDAVVGRTDTMIVAAFRHRDGEVAAFSIPRDLWVELPDVGELHEEGRDHARISSVIRVGEARLGRGEGIPLLRRVLREQLGITVDRYARVDFAGFVALVDELDGVEVEVQCPIMDCFWVDGPDRPCKMMEVEAGRVHMDGSTALAFVRSRHGTGDRDRTRRQQAVILAFAAKVEAGGLRGLRGLWRTVEPFIDTDLGADDAAYYASFALENDLGSVGGFAIAHPMTRRHVTEDGKHVLLLDRSAFETALDGMFDSELPALRDRRRCPEPDAALNYRSR